MVKYSNCKFGSPRGHLKWQKIHKIESSQVCSSMHKERKKMHGNKIKCNKNTPGMYVCAYGICVREFLLVLSKCKIR